MMRRTLLILLAFLSSGTGLVSCGKSEKDLAVAKVGDVEITIKDLKEFVAGLPDHLKTKKTGLEGQRDHLQTMIDREILLLEVRDRGLDKSGYFIARMEKEKRRKILEEFQRREIADKIVVTEEEMRGYFIENDLDRKLRLSHILVETEGEARAVLDEIEKGRSFEEVARERSIDENTREQGGDLGMFVRKSDIIRIDQAIAEKAFSLDVGEISEPIKTKYGYSIVKLMDERPVNFEELRGGIRRRLRRQKFYLRKDQLVEELEDRLRLELNQKALALLLERGETSEDDLPQLSENERKVALYVYDGEEITLGDYLDRLKRTKLRPAAGDSAQVVGFTKRALIPDVLLLEAARRARVEEDEKVAYWLKRKEEDLLIEELRRVEVADKVEITEDEVRSLYDEHPDWYTLPEEITVREILVETEDEAEEILRTIKEGADMGELAEKHTIREWVKTSKGKFHIHSFEKPIYGGLVEEAMEAEIGQIVGPVPVRGGYSVFKVLEKLENRPEPFEKARRRIEGRIRHEKENLLFRQFLSQLREKYAPQVVVSEDNLKVAVD